MCKSVHRRGDGGYRDGDGGKATATATASIMMLPARRHMDQSRRLSLL